MQKALEPLSVGELLQYLTAAFFCEVRAIVVALDTLLNPRLLVGVLDMHELIADVPTISQSKDFFDLAHRRDF